ncbi:MAG: YidC/Oxa1 family membrane protein insertase [Lachnospiraceae bacterium]
MINVLLTQNDGAILGPIAKLLGYIMDAIFNGLAAIGVPSIGFSIILFTLVIYLCMMPLTIKQQKFSKLSAKMNPELQAIQAKYKNKKDNESMTRMNEETKAVYEKYGTSPTGSCLQLVIQMPILFALYRVIYNIPAYVDTVKQAFIPFVSKFIEQPGSLEFIQNTENFSSASQFSKQFSNELFTGGNTEYITNTVIDILNKASTSEWHNIYASGNFESLKNLVTNASGTGSLDLIERYNSFLGLNISNSPSYILKEAFSTGSYLLIIGAVMIPVLAALTQWLNTKLMPQPEATTDQQSTMASSMKTMNVMMPAMSAVFCFTLPAGMGLYWIAGAVIRSIQQIAINKHLDKEDLDEVIRKNVEKAKKKRDKLGVPSQTVTNSAKISTKTIVDNNKTEKPQSDKEEAVKKATEYYNKGVKAGSIASKANMVKQYNEKNNK